MKVKSYGYRNIYVSTETHQALKIAACNANVTMKEFVDVAIKEKAAALEKEAGKKK